jgi:hypothetical protein
MNSNREPDLEVFARAVSKLWSAVLLIVEVPVATSRVELNKGERRNFQFYAEEGALFLDEVLKVFSVHLLLQLVPAFGADHIAANVGILLEDLNFFGGGIRNLLRIVLFPLTLTPSMALYIVGSVFSMVFSGASATHLKPCG